LLIGIFLLLPNPLSSQVVARAAHRTGVSMTSATKIDLLEENRGEKS
jgi:multicomponent Na+:H+ antiporter subunit G